jgi:tetratricopeptide (TPR) repeat protein
MRVGKWARRHRRSIAAALTVACTALVVHTLLLTREQAAKRDALVRSHESLRHAHTVLDRLGSRVADQLAAIPGAEGVRHQLLQDSLDLYQQFEQQASKDAALSTDLALAHSKMGGLSEKMGHREQALAEHEKALAIWKQRVAEEPANAEFQSHLARCHNNLGMLLFDMGRQAESLVMLRKARELQQSLSAADRNSLDCAFEIATTHGVVGLVLSQMGDAAEAIKEFKQAITIHERLAKSWPENEVVVRGLVAGYNNLGLAVAATDSDLAAEVFRKAIAVGRQLVQSNPINRLHQGELARTYNNLGFVSCRRKDWTHAEKCYADAIRIQRLLVDALPGSVAYRRDLAISYNNLGMAQNERGQWREAEASFQEAVRLHQDLLAKQPEDIQLLSNQGSVFNNLGMLLDRDRRYAEAENAYRQAIQLQKQALDSEASSPRFRVLLSRHYVNYARNLCNQQQPAKAVEIALERKALWPTDPERLYSIAEDLAAAYGMMIGSASDKSLSKEACARAAIDTLREALAAGLPAQRLNDSSLAAIAGTEAFRQLVAEAGDGRAATAQHQAGVRDLTRAER